MVGSKEEDLGIINRKMRAYQRLSTVKEQKNMYQNKMKAFILTKRRKKSKAKTPKIAVIKKITTSHL